MYPRALHQVYILFIMFGYQLKYVKEYYQTVILMQETILGKTGLKIKKLGFGGIPIQRVSEEDAIVVVRRCFELGINYYDTARAYSVSEERIGKSLEDVRDEVILASKSGRRDGKGLLEELDISLRNLRTDHIDVYQLHNVSSKDAWEKIKKPGGALEALYKAKNDGKILHLGITSHDPAILTDIVREDVFETIMIPYNYLTYQPEEALLPLCKKMNVGTVIMKPFGGGAFSNANTALKFSLGKNFSDVVIPGVAHIHEVEENVQIASRSYTLSENELELIEKDRKELDREFCRACGYCQPCQKGIPISYVMRAESQFLKRMGWRPGMEEQMIKAVKATYECIKCGACEEKCPYHLRIRMLLPQKAHSLRKLLEERDAW